jgi:hypothetical protein
LKVILNICYYIFQADERIADLIERSPPSPASAGNRGVQSSVIRLDDENEDEDEDEDKESDNEDSSGREEETQRSMRLKNRFVEKYGKLRKLHAEQQRQWKDARKRAEDDFEQIEKVTEKLRKLTEAQRKQLDAEKLARV